MVAVFAGFVILCKDLVNHVHVYIQKQEKGGATLFKNRKKGEPHYSKTGKRGSHTIQKCKQCYWLKVRLGSINFCSSIHFRSI